MRPFLPHLVLCLCALSLSSAEFTSTPLRLTFPQAGPSESTTTRFSLSVTDPWNDTRTLSLASLRPMDPGVGAKRLRLLLISPQGQSIGRIHPEDFRGLNNMEGDQTVFFMSFDFPCAGEWTAVAQFDVWRNADGDADGSPTKVVGTNLPLTNVPVSPLNGELFGLATGRPVPSPQKESQAAPTGIPGVPPNRLNKPFEPEFLGDDIVGDEDMEDDVPKEDGWERRRLARGGSVRQTSQRGHPRAPLKPLSYSSHISQPITFTVHPSVSDVHTTCALPHPPTLPEAGQLLVHAIPLPPLDSDLPDPLVAPITPAAQLVHPSVAKSTGGLNAEDPLLSLLRAKFYLPPAKPASAPSHSGPPRVVPLSPTALPAHECLLLVVSLAKPGYELASTDLAAVKVLPVPMFIPADDVVPLWGEVGVAVLVQTSVITESSDTPREKVPTLSTAIPFDTVSSEEDPASLCRGPVDGWSPKPRSGPDLVFPLRFPSPGSWTVHIHLSHAPTTTTPEGATAEHHQLVPLGFGVQVLTKTQAAPEISEEIRQGEAIEWREVPGEWDPRTSAAGELLVGKDAPTTGKIQLADVPPPAPVPEKPSKVHTGPAGTGFGGGVGPIKPGKELDNIPYLPIPPPAASGNDPQPPVDLSPPSHHASSADGLAHLPALTGTPTNDPAIVFPQPVATAVDAEIALEEGGPLPSGRGLAMGYFWVTMLVVGATAVAGYKYFYGDGDEGGRGSAFGGAPGLKGWFGGGGEGYEMVGREVVEERRMEEAERERDWRSMEAER
ncbi:hypothetical protein M427DRAFT_55418 [Gonapodya prolifera JEL478]|uniref:Uncharacterized protein n=1 Tax=Gonapodya prolifera (strain JEL478) TaxID=1344416 RepID=A0A139AJ19_GONPJ|nr:hypothetical protein M427DRAFT_55418 [Gonapodya prolifera JEL478]|eukprot:KXS16463.1 hypothetical protein M427DRAFT_55418 [Gonapodya prolifera JEL478]